MKDYLAVDIGASSGRLMSSQLKDGQIVIEEEHRFPNGFTEKEGYSRWDTEHLLKEILVGLEKVYNKGITKCSLGIDTWAVDYALLNEEGELIDEIISYRDSRTDHAIESFTKEMTKEAVYQKTGIQFLPFNTLFQLFVEEKERLAQAKDLLLVPDYLAYSLTGEKVFEKTNASTTQLLNIETGQLDQDLLEIIEIKPDLFPELIQPGEQIGYLDHSRFPTYELPEVEVYAVASHDTASAVIGTPGQGDDWAFLSSGTWSLLGVELAEPVVTPEAYQENYTNEAGAYDTTRFLKNITGMWLVQEVSRNLDHQYSYEELKDLAKASQPFQQTIDVNDARFLNPSNIVDEIKNYCRETEQVVPDSVGQVVRCIYDSLAVKYKEELAQLEKITGKELNSLIVVGGGRNIDLLNQTIADLAQVSVYAGPSEATALGNVMVQMIAKGEIHNLEEGRKIIADSFQSEVYLPA